MDALDVRVSQAVREFWKTRSGQIQRQGLRGGRKDQGNRPAVTGGKLRWSHIVGQFGSEVKVYSVV